MSSLSRVIDISVGTCCCHHDPKCISSIGIFVTGDPVTNIESNLSSRIGDVVVTSCGHVSIGASGFSQINIDGSATSHIGAIVVGCMNGVVVSGAPTTYF